MLTSNPTTRLLLIHIIGILLIFPIAFASTNKPEHQNNSVLLNTNLIQIGKDTFETLIFIEQCKIKIKAVAPQQDLILTDITNSVPALSGNSEHLNILNTIYFWDKDLCLIYKDQEDLKNDWESIKKIHTQCESQVFKWNSKNLSDILPDDIRQYGEWPVRFPSDESKVTLIPKGKSSLIQRHQLISQARLSIWYKTFEFYGDESGISIAESLISKKKNENLDIRVFVDAFPLWMESDHRTVVNTERLYSNLMAAGIPVFGATCKKGKAIYKEMSEDINGLKHLNYRYHEKSLITDAGTIYPTKKAIIGGLNSTNQYFRIGLEKWSDVDMLAMGKSVNDIGTAFLEDWDSYGKKNKADFSCLNPHSPDTREFQKFFKNHSKSYIEPNTKQNKINQMISEAEIHQLKNGIYPIGRYYDASIKFIRNSPRKGQRGYKNAIESSLIKFFDEARNEIIISNIYFIPSRRMIKALRRAVFRGVNITILTNSKKSNSQHANVRLSRFYYETIANPYVKHLNIKRFFKTMLSKNYRLHRDEWNQKPEYERGRVTFYEFQGEPDTIVEVSSNNLPEPEPGSIPQPNHPIKKTIHNLIRGDRSGLTLLHSKYFVIDRKFTCIGSYNIDPRSRNLSREHVLWVESNEFATDLLQKFSEDISLSHKISENQMHDFRHPDSSLKQLNLWLTRSFESML